MNIGEKIVKFQFVKSRGILIIGAFLGVFLLASCTQATTPPSALSAPIGTSATAGNGQVTVSWTAVTGATSYNLYWSTSSGVTTSTGTKISGVASPYTQTSLANGITYYYVVTAVSAGGESAASNSASATPQVSLPVAPTGVGAVAGNGQVTVSWTAVTGATSYNLYWSTTSGVTTANGTKIGGVSTGYVQSGLASGTIYYYVVTAVNASGESAASSQASATPGGVPTGVIAAAGSGQVTITWNAVSGATQYNLYWSTSSGVTTSNGTKVGGVSSGYVQGSLTSGTTYYYIVTADVAGVEYPSSQASATPGGAPTGVIATAGHEQVTITWNAVPGATQYNLYWSTASGVTTSNGTKVGGVSSGYVQGGLADGTTYYYIVTADIAGVEYPSSQVSAAPYVS